MAAASLRTPLQLFISCKSLKKMDLTSKSDPLCVVYLQDTQTGREYQEIGRTEVLKDTSNPQFITSINVDYLFEEVQNLKFVVYDTDSESSDLSKHDLIGQLETRLSELMGMHRGNMTAQLKVPGKDSSRGTITIAAEEVSSGQNNDVRLVMRGIGLDKKDFMGKSDPFVVMYRQGSSGSWIKVHETEVIKKTLDPIWKEQVVTAGTLCGGDMSKPIKFECYDWDANNDNDLIGICEATLQQLCDSPGLELELINPKKEAKKKGYKNSGILRFDSCQVKVHPSFLDYIRAGFQINFTVAVDFTASNGDPRRPESLHFYNPPTPNSYVEAIQAIGGVLQDYDTDKLFPALGFGAKLPDGTVSHEFALNGNPANPFCAGIGGVLEAYAKTLGMVQLYGPTNFAPVIQHASRIASQADGRSYFILLIITDGVISDIDNTIHAIVEASELPLSIIIVGVGSADFTSMEVLDADEKKLESRGRVAKRDIVQFVPFIKYKSANAQALAKEVLAEVPKQFIQYMEAMDISP